MKKMKRQTKKKGHRRKPVAPRVPKNLKGMVLRKFKSKDRSRRFLVVRLPKDEGTVVQVVTRKSEGPTVVREFRTPLPSQSGVPTPVHLEVGRETAIWWARHIAKNNHPPSEDQERRRRKRYMRKSLTKYAEHVTTKHVIEKLNGKPPLRMEKKQIKMPFICFYNPLARKKDAVFSIHKAHCTQLDAMRRRTLKKGGTSWVIEALTAEEAMRLQLEEFNEEDKGYIGADFDIHDCGGMH